MSSFKEIYGNLGARAVDYVTLPYNAVKMEYLCLTTDTNPLSPLKAIGAVIGLEISKIAAGGAGLIPLASNIGMPPSMKSGSTINDVLIAAACALFSNYVMNTVSINWQTEAELCPRTAARKARKGALLTAEA